MARSTRARAFRRMTSGGASPGNASFINSMTEGFDQILPLDFITLTPMSFLSKSDTFIQPLPIFLRLLCLALSLLKHVQCLKNSFVELHTALVSILNEFPEAGVQRFRNDSF